MIWDAMSMNSNGQLTQYQSGNSLTTTKTYDCLGILRSIVTGTVQNNSYSFDEITGNMVSRKDNLNNLTEIFSYDNIGRLTEVSGPALLSTSYANNGNIVDKTSVGNYSYGTLPHAVTGVTNPDGLISNYQQRLTYTSFNKTDSIIENTGIYTLTYGANDQRTLSKFYNNGTLQKTVYYVGNYEKEVVPGSYDKHIHYIYGGDGLAAISTVVYGTTTMYYVHKDHLGSLDKVTNSSGAVVQTNSFDAWGRRRNPTNWTYNSIPASIFSRGYTGHEHLDFFGLINMNGRMYDPILGRFFSPDNFVQGPDFSQSFNRYSYCLNNPLKYSDPSGEKWEWPKWRQEHWIPIFGQFNYLMEMINDNTVKLRQKMIDAEIPAFSIGASANSGGGLTVYGSVGSGPIMPAIAYNSNSGIGYGNANPGFSTFYYPSINYNAPEENAIRAVHDGISASYNYPYLPLSYIEAREFVINLSKGINKEVTIIDTDRGVYLEKHYGYANYNNKWGYYHNNLQLSIPYNSQKDGILKLDKSNYRAWSKMNYTAHPHPGNNYASPSDWHAAGIRGVRSFIWGWGGKDYYVEPGWKFSLDTIFLFYDD